MKNTNFNSNKNFIIYYNFLSISIFNTKLQSVNYYNKYNHKIIKNKKIIIIINVLTVY